MLGLIDGRVPLFEFAIKSRIEGHDLSTAEGRVAALDAAAPVIAGIKDQALRHTYAVRLDSMLGFLDERFVVGRVAQINRWQRERAARGERGAGPGQAPPQSGRPAQAPQRPAGFRPDPRDMCQAVQREVLKLALQAPELVAPAFDHYEADEFTAPAYAAVRAAIAAAGGVSCDLAPTPNWVAEVRAAAPDDTIRHMVTELAVESLHRTAEPDRAYADGNLVRLRVFSAERRIADAKSRLLRIDPVRDVDAYALVWQELTTLETYKRALVDRGAEALYAPGG